MKTRAMVLCVGWLAAAAGANDIQFWFSTEANVQTAAAVGPFNPTIQYPRDSSIRLYLYANTPGRWAEMYDPNYACDYVGWMTDNTWEGVALDLFFQGDAVLGADNKVLNNAAGGLLRWNLYSDLTWTPINGTAMSERGIGGANNGYNGGHGALFDAKQCCSVPHQVGWCGTLTTQVGWIEVMQPAAPHPTELFLVIGQQGIARRQGDVNTDHIFFGVGDPGLRGDAFGWHSGHYDALFIPEPTAFALFVLAGLALRRRWLGADLLERGPGR